MGWLPNAKTFLFDVVDQERSPVHGESDILVEVQAGSSNADGLPLRIGFGHSGPHEPPTENSEREALAKITGRSLHAR